MQRDAGFLATSDGAFWPMISRFFCMVDPVSLAKVGAKSLSPPQIKTRKNNGLKWSKSTEWRK
jgi:hypothetical protein